MTQPQQETQFVKGDWDSISGIRRFSHQAMATTFEIIVQHDDAHYAQQAARQAFEELDRLEAELSRFIENSDISRINNLVANQPLQIGLSTFECLQLAAQIYAETNGAFDITIGSLLSTGTHLIKLNEDEHTVRLLAAPIQIDLGGIGKGFAVDRVAELLREWSIETTLISGGYSSVLALDAPVDTKGWPLTLSNPDNRKQILARPCLQGRAMSGSGLQKGQHIIDPRTSKPAHGKHAAWASASDAATADALSTAFMVMSPEEIEQYCLHHPEVQAMVIIKGQATEKDEILHFGPWNEGDLLK